VASWIRQRIAATLFIIVSLIGSLVVTASPAAAAQACQPSSREFVHPGLDPNTFVTITLCVISTSGDTRVQGRAQITWTRALELPYDEFERFRVTVQVRYNGVSRNSNNCDIKLLLNTYRTGTTFCFTSQLAKTGSRLWDTAGSVLYNVNFDNRGDQTWPLTRTPRI
jgi:hypothetical protein